MLWGANGCVVAKIMLMCVCGYGEVNEDEVVGEVVVWLGCESGCVV